MADGVCSVMVAREIVALSVKVRTLAFPRHFFSKPSRGNADFD